MLACVPATSCASTTFGAAARIQAGESTWSGMPFSTPPRRRRSGSSSGRCAPGFTSCLPGEVKTFVANNLAHALARQQNCRVLLIDADLRRPDLHPGFGAQSSPGLAEYLKGEVDEMAIIQRGLPEYLCFIPGGKQAANSAELLANGRLRVLLDTVGPVFDWVILDSPPTLPVSDALVLADHCDGVLTVIRAAQTGFDSAQKSCQQLREKNLLGVALNCAEDGSAYGAYYEEQSGTGLAN